MREKNTEFMFNTAHCVSILPQALIICSTIQEQAPAALLQDSAVERIKTFSAPKLLANS